ncbi:hypothetical protein KAI32_03330 [Candidatus Pacearchaeota archaeon]|nr:hypothetical protein [Candidatus Pacearchaeota archaeon]
MRGWGHFIIVFALLVIPISFVSAEYSIDISGLKESYAVGEEINYKVLLLEDGGLIERNVEVIFLDDLGISEIKLNVESNEENTLKVSENFSSLGWSVKAKYEDKEVIRPFMVQENLEIEFVLDGENLIIKNKGNVRYTRTVQIQIGDETESYVQNIPVGGQKTWVLVAPQGDYDIKITDGTNTFTKKDVQLTSIGTGNAIGAMGEGQQITGLLGGPIDLEKMDESLISSNKSYVAITFICAVFGIGILLFIERRKEKK